mgnify:FL=1
MEIIWKKEPRKGNVTLSKTAGAAITVNTDTKKQKGQTVVTIYQPLMKKMRILVGDRAIVGHTDTHIAIKRVTEGGYSVSALGACGSVREKKIGTIASSAIKFSGRVGDFKITQRIVFDIDEIEITDDCVALLPLLDRLTRS